jgi:O-antigen ligase
VDVETPLFLSLLLQAGFGIAEFAQQRVPAMAWLGIASQDPAELGVSVVETASGRILRAYGAMPHPNVFGAWMAFGALLASWRASCVRRAWVAWGMVAIYTVAMVLSFSRGAWLGWLVGLCGLGWAARRRHLTWVAMGIGIVVFLGGVVAFRSVVAPRFVVASRLETKSVDERREAWERGWTAWRAHPLVGIGLGRAGLQGWPKGGAYPAPPPHVVPLVALEEIGVLGLLGLMLLAGGWLGRFRRESLPWFGLLLGVGLVDHFLWTLWPGHVLALFLLYFSFIHLDKTQEIRRIREPEKGRMDDGGKEAFRAA